MKSKRNAAAVASPLSSALVASSSSSSATASSRSLRVCAAAAATFHTHFMEMMMVMLLLMWGMDSPPPQWQSNTFLFQLQVTPLFTAAIIPTEMRFGPRPHPLNIYISISFYHRRGCRYTAKAIYSRNSITHPSHHFDRSSTVYRKHKATSDCYKFLFFFLPLHISFAQRGSLE